MLPDAVASVGRLGLGATLVYGILVALCHMRLAYLCRQEVQVPAIADDWAMLGRDEAKAVWFACSAFLHQYGIILFGDPRLRNMTFWGEKHFIKAVRASSEEWRIIKYLSTGANRRNSWNRILGVLVGLSSVGFYSDETHIGQAVNRGKCLSFGQHDIRLFGGCTKGLCFMHMHGIAHCDLHPGNVVCNHEDLHPPHTRWPPGTTQPAFQNTFNFQLAFIDFEAATRFPTQAQSHVGQLESAPPSPFSAPECQPACEESETEECATQECEIVEYDMFAADVYSLGPDFAARAGGSFRGKSHRSHRA
ncbi:hypothetical protein B0H14DRAFT_2622560 [Mycena olivaceomarginata]|nr:hypothetical protein B0H14DRAFT_2622560 [Mycena olivaceomarginata]